MIKIVGLGPGEEKDLTIGALEAIKEGKKVLLRTKKTPVASYLERIGVNFSSYDHYYEELHEFKEVYENIAVDIINKYYEYDDIVYAVPGNPLEAERSVLNLINLCKEKNIEYEILASVGFIDALTARLEIDPTDGLKIIDAFDISEAVFDKRVALVISQVYNPFIASEVKLKLCDYYDEETEIFYCKALGIRALESIKKIPLYELDMQEDLDYLTTVYVPKDAKSKKDIYDLIKIVEILRGDNGCPWDREQDHNSIKKAIVEESYEVVDAIDNDDDDGIIEELGDVLLQVVFHAVIGKEEGYYNLNDIVDGICNKMIYRHPHVFGDTRVKDSNEVLANWDELKKKEKGQKSTTEELQGVAKALPALIRAKKIQAKAKKVGFDWDTVEEAAVKVNEELKEVLDVYKSGNRAMITEEIGDLIFSCVNVSRFLDVDAEEALNITTDKFIKRFNYIETKVAQKQLKLTDMSLEDMDILWNEAKKLEK